MLLPGHLKYCTFLVFREPGPDLLPLLELFSEKTRQGTVKYRTETS